MPVKSPSPQPVFSNLAAETGLDFTHFNGMTGKLCLPEIMGSGAALFDCDNDGDMDVFFVQGKAVDFFEKALERVPEANRVHYSLAMAYRKLDLPEKAKEHIAQQGEIGIKVKDPLLESIGTLRKSTGSRLLEAKTAFDAGGYGAAAAIYAKVLKSEPENITALGNIGAAYLKMGQAQEAIAAFERVTQLKPENTNAYYNLGIVYSLAGKPFQAIANFKSLLKYRPDDTDARFRLARELRKAELLDKSLGEYRKVLEQQPKNEEALLDLVSLMSAQGMDKELFELLKRARTIPFEE